MQLTLFYFMKTCPRETCQTCCQTQFQHPRELSTSSLLVTKDGRTCNGSGTIGALSNCCSSSTIRCPNSAVLPLHQGLDQAPRALRCLVRLRYHAHTHTHAEMQSIQVYLVKLQCPCFVVYLLLRVLVLVLLLLLLLLLICHMIHAAIVSDDIRYCCFLSLSFTRRHNKAHGPSPLCTSSRNLVTPRNALEKAFMARIFVPD